VPMLMLVTTCGSASCLAKQVVGYQPAGVLEAWTVRGAIVNARSQGDPSQR